MVFADVLYVWGNLIAELERQKQNNTGQT